MASNVQELRPKPPETEKITINLGYVDLGHVDLMVQEGFYSNRTDFIRTAIRNQLERHTDAVKQSVARHQLDLGRRQYSRQDLEAVQAAGETLHIQVLGLAVIAADVSPELARATISSIHVLGALQASPALKTALRDRIRRHVVPASSDSPLTPSQSLPTRRAALPLCLNATKRTSFDERISKIRYDNVPPRPQRAPRNGDGDCSQHPGQCVV